MPGGLRSRIESSAISGLHTLLSLLLYRRVVCGVAVIAAKKINAIAWA